MKKPFLLLLTSLLLSQCVEPGTETPSRPQSLRPHTAVRKSSEIISRTTFGFAMEATTVEVEGHQWIVFQGGSYGHIDVKHNPSCPCGWQKKNLAESE